MFITGEDETSNNLLQLSENRTAPDEYFATQTYFPIKTEISSNSELKNDKQTENAFNVVKTEARVTDESDELNIREKYSVTGFIDQTFLFSSPLWIETKDDELSSSLLALDNNELAKTDNVYHSKSVNEPVNGVENPLRKSKRTKMRNRWISFDENVENSGRTRRKVTKLRQESAVIGSKPNVKPLRRYQKPRVKPSNNVDISVTRDGQQCPETDLISQLLQQFNESSKQESGDNISVTESTGNESDQSEESAKMSAVKSNTQKKRKDASTKEVHRCEVCNKSFSSPAYLSKHVVTHSRQSAHKDYVEQHMIQHSAQAKHCCEICGKMYSAAYTLKLHQAKHDFPRPYSCEKCSKSFFREDRLKSHMLRHSVSADNLYYCEFCGNSYKDVNTLRWHMQNHSNVILKCEKCEKVFKKPSYFRYHMMYVHDGVKRFCCHTCGKGFARQTSLTLHLASHTSERRFDCITCGKSFKLKTALRKHEIVHKTEKHHTCTVCQRQFGRADNLKTHMVTHSSVKPHICHICGASFNHAVSLRQHMRRHGSSLND